MVGIGKNLHFDPSWQSIWICVYGISAWDRALAYKGYRIRFEVGDGTQMRFTPSKFDAIYSWVTSTAHPHLTSLIVLDVMSSFTFRIRQHSWITSIRGWKTMVNYWSPISAAVKHRSLKILSIMLGRVCIHWHPFTNTFKYVRSHLIKNDSHDDPSVDL